MKYMSTFNILGSCICRDLFGFQTDCPHEIIHFLQSTSPLTWFIYNKKPKKLITMDQMNNIQKLKNFQKKCVMHDYNNSVLDYYVEKTDYFIIDLVSLFNPNLGKEVFEDGTEHYFTISKWFSILYKNGLDACIGNTYKVVNRYELITEEILEKVISSLVQWLTYEKGYREEEIILIENKHANCYTEGEFLYFFKKSKETKKINDCLDKAYQLFESYVPNCNIIKMPLNTYGDYFHRWSLYSLHFTKEYYDYLYQCINLICADADNYKKRICELRENVAELFCGQVETFTKNTIQQLKRNENLITDIPNSRNCANLLVVVDFLK